MCLAFPSNLVQMQGHTVAIKHTPGGDVTFWAGDAPTDSAKVPALRLTGSSIVS